MQPRGWGTLECREEQVGHPAVELYKAGMNTVEIAVTFGYERGRGNKRVANVRSCVREFISAHHESKKAVVLFGN